MARIFKSSLLIALVFGVVWLAVIIWWQESHTLPTAIDIGMLLFALPLALLCAGWLGLKAVRAARAPKPAAQAPAALQDPAPAAPQASRMAVLATATRAAPGATALAIREAVASQKRPELDAELQDGKGFPIFAARVAELDTAWLGEEAKRANPGAAPLDHEPLRAAELLAQVVESLCEDAAGQLAQTLTPTKDADWPTLRLDLLLPAAWNAAAQEHAVARARAGRGAWPAARIVITPHAAADEAATVRLLQQLASESAAAQDGALRIAAACDSYISGAQAREWDSRKLLMTHANPQGRVPGEAAAGVLLSRVPTDTAAATPSAPSATSRASSPSAATPPAESDELPPEAQVVTLSSFAHRATQADARGAGSDTALADLTGRFLEEQEIKADDIAAMVSDADHRGSRPLETMGLASTVFTSLDPNQDCLAVGAACGYTGVASTLLTLAVACDACIETTAPVLMALTQDPALRVLALVAPPDRYRLKPQPDLPNDA